MGYSGSLHLSIEAFLTIGETIISEFNLRKPDTYADIPRILFDNKVIAQKLKDQLVDLARFRNVIVHDYLHIDHTRVYPHLQNDVAILKKFIQSIKKYIHQV